MDALWRINRNQGNPSDYEYYVNIMLNVENLATNENWGVDLGLGIINEDGVYNSIYDNAVFKENWDGNVTNFTLSCN